MDITLATEPDIGKPVWGIHPTGDGRWILPEVSRDLLDCGESFEEIGVRHFGIRFGSKTMPNT